jgi:hypothetical protein
MPDSDPTIFSSRIPDPDPNIFHPGTYMKSGMNTYFFLAAYAFCSKVLVLVLVKGSGIRKNSYQPDPGSGSTILFPALRKMFEIVCGVLTRNKKIECKFLSASSPLSLVLFVLFFEKLCIVVSQVLQLN